VRVVSFLDRLRARGLQVQSAPDVPRELPASLLDRLTDQELGSVVFLVDYAQFDFNGPRLSTFVWPEVRLSGETTAGRGALSNGDQGYRDALCSLIGSTVTGVLDSPKTGLVIQFGGAALVVNPAPADLQGPEIAVFQVNDDEHSWEVWRPGEGSFAAHSG